ncbi:unannotated protein [freshwater metagenome]|uniref:Unannotated protein n=1 Tax=freshwater metagenome TaxID=449393 RepID=A0A6J6U1S3_9ZZZZ|nr:TIGR03943 family protein [Actinomycetota bacterium]
MVVAVRLPTQGLLLMFLGAVLLRIAGTDAYLRYVVEWMRWPLLVSGALLLLLALGPLLREDTDEEHGHDHGEDGHGHGVPRVTWLLVLPGIIAFVVSPPELGSYLAERRADDLVAVSAPTEATSLGGDGPVDLPVEEFMWLAQVADPELEEQQVTLTGFVSYGGGEDGGWYVTRMQIGCCAADAMAYRVKVDGAERPERDEWVAVTGTHVTGTGVEPPFEVVLAAESVEIVDEPLQTYE